jgi:hypothetical protein
VLDIAFETVASTAIDVAIVRVLVSSKAVVDVIVRVLDLSKAVVDVIVRVELDGEYPGVTHRASAHPADVLFEGK